MIYKLIHREDDLEMYQGLARQQLLWLSCQRQEVGAEYSWRAGRL